jgi:O-phospho-L-seryl-tRNASec:L-selenocysteinyl-tRNA synthase
VGEREGRIFSSMVSDKNYSLGHGIGRSGDVNALQPKAIGSSLIVKLTRAMVLHVLKKFCGLPCIQDVIVLPFATGMAITMTLLTLKSLRPAGEYVVWSRIDQKTCLKAITAANLKPIVIEEILVGDELRTDVEGIKEALTKFGDKILCVTSTTSCFAPRAIDSVVEIGILCK